MSARRPTIRSEQRCELAHVGHVGAAQAKALGDRSRVRPPEEAPLSSMPSERSLWNLQPVGAFVEHADQELQSMAADRLELLDMHHQAAATPTFQVARW